MVVNSPGSNDWESSCVAYKSPPPREILPNSHSSPHSAHRTTLQTPPLRRYRCQIWLSCHAARAPAPYCTCALGTLDDAPTSSTPPHCTRRTSWPVLDPSTMIFIIVVLFPMTKMTPLKPMAMATPTRNRPRPVPPPSRCRDASSVGS
jgi:hypothetical protein